MMKKLLGLLRMAPLALLFASVASAQTTGTVIGVVTDGATGKPVAGAVIIARSPNLQGEQTAVTDDKGNYRITQLPPGSYTLAVQLEGYKPAERSDIQLRLDKTIRANIAVIPEAVTMEEQTVRTGAAPVVNVGAAESGAVVAREFVANVPVGRTVEAVSATVPTASSDLYGVGFAGAQSPENAYILDGLNVTDPVYGTFGGNPTAQTPQQSLLTNFIQEVDVKTGGFMPEFGRATGGVLNMVAKSGSNEFHGSLWGNMTPRMLFQGPSRVAGAAGEAVAWRQNYAKGAYDADFGFEVGGPIQKDKLWFYAGFAPVVTKRTTERYLRANVLNGDPGYGAECVGQDPLEFGRCILADGSYKQTKIAGTDSTTTTGRTTYQGIAKLSYIFNENHSLTVSGFGLPSTTSNYAMNSSDGRRKIDATDNLFDFIGRYAGKYLDKRLVIEAMAGYHQSSSKDDPTAFQRNTPTIEFYDQNYNVGMFEASARGTCGDGTADPARCPVQQYRIGGAGYLNDTTAKRLAGRLVASYLWDGFGSHAAKLGLDVERSTYDISKNYGGGAFYRTRTPTQLTVFRAYGNVVCGDPTQCDSTGTYVDSSKLNPTGTDAGFTLAASSNTSVSTSTAVFAQDSWTLPVANITLNYGVRWEGQKMYNKDNPSKNGFSIMNNWAPRLQAIWDFTGNGRGKVAATWGRFFYNIPMDMGDRAFGNESQVRYRVNMANCSNWASTVGAGDATGLNYGAINITDPSCPIVHRAASAATENRPWYVAQTGGITYIDPNLQGVFIDQFGGQFEYEVISDLSVGFEYTGRRQGQVIEDMSSDDGNTYYIANPGYTKDFHVNEDGQTTTTGCSAADRANGNCYSSKTAQTFDPATGRLITVNFPKPERSYDGFTFFVRKNFSKNWLASAAYTYSTLRGNMAGPYRPEDGQIDPGITSEYDLASLMANRKGYLPGDQTHQLKLYGAYTWPISQRFSVTGGAAFTTHSGDPVSVLGAHPDYGTGQAFILPRGMGGRSAWISNLDLRGQLEYVIKPPYAIKFSVDVFNVLNSQEITTIDEDYTYDSVQPIPGLKCTTSAPSASNPLQKLQSDCPDLKYLKTTDGRAVTVNPNWGKAAAGTASFQAPLSIRFGVQLAF